MVIFRKRSEKELLNNFEMESQSEEKSKIEAERYESKELKNIEKVSSFPAPLFVKVEKYREIITTIQEIKTLIAGLRNLFSIIEEIDQVKSDALNTLRITLQRVEKNIIQLDANFLRTGSEEIEKVKETIRPRAIEANELEDSLKQLYEELAAMKDEIEKMKSL
ncbi:MAG: hypothetical protein QXL09_01480 [Candidatus Aenigmatarchaeota archaeon]